MPLLKGLAPKGTLLPYHHTVSSRFLPHIGHLYNYKNETQFCDDLDYMLRYYNAVSLDEVVDSISKTGRTPKNAFLLSFDDGYKEIYTTIAPILQKKGIPAVFFLNPSFIDNKSLFYRCKISLMIGEVKKTFASPGLLKIFAEVLQLKQEDEESLIEGLKKTTQDSSGVLDVLAEKCGFSFDTFLQHEQPFVTAEMVKSLHQQGFSIGAHSMNHPYYHLLTLQEQLAQTVDSCNSINNLLGIQDCSFSFPYSDKEIKQVFFDETRDKQIPIFFGIQNQKTEIKNRVLHRFNAERPETPTSFQLKGLLFMMTMRKLMGQQGVKRS